MNLVDRFIAHMARWMPYYGMHMGLADNVSLTGIFTVVSFMKSYACRRFFNMFWKGMKG